VHIEINSVPAGEPARRAFELGYGHFTAMQVRDGATRGLDLHLRRLDGAHRELFGKPYDGDAVRAAIRHALDGAGRRDASVRVYAYEDDTVVTVREPAAPPREPWRLRSVPYQRPAAHIKHLGGFGQDYHRRRAHAEGFDEALLTGADGVVAEGGITNVGFLTGDGIRWPDAPALAGIAMQLLQIELTRRGVPWRHGPVHLRELPSFDGAFVSNSHGLRAVTHVDDLALPVDAALLAMLVAAYDSVAWDGI
jgi:branched-subunit amino acid aminotransferase/4-amino-4-deoxychorismate lyase